PARSRAARRRRWPISVSPSKRSVSYQHRRVSQTQRVFESVSREALQRFSEPCSILGPPRGRKGRKRRKEATANQIVSASLASFAFFHCRYTKTKPALAERPGGELPVCGRFATDNPKTR